MKIVKLLLGNLLFGGIGRRAKKKARKKARRARRRLTRLLCTFMIGGGLAAFAVLKGRKSLDKVFHKS